MDFKGPAFRKVVTMRYTVSTLEAKLDQIQQWISRGTFLSLSPEEVRALREEAGRLSGKFTALRGSFLTLGLLGGTGVGKSTIMNALAGFEIASTSHRRPHTDHILLYRHSEVDPLPALALGDALWRDITHQVDAIRHIVICDLPDFDSLVGENRQHVLQFLEHLDLLVWIASPEKYADGRFYEFLQLVPKAKENFTFVLNKTDLFFQDDLPETGYKQLGRVLSHFQELIRDRGVDDPLLYAVSAEEALRARPLAPWNQFHGFRKHVFQQRDVKRISAIKAANLDVEIQKLFSALLKEARDLKHFEGILHGAVKDLEDQKSMWSQVGREIIELWATKRIQPGVIFSHGDAPRLLGPGYAFALLFRAFQQRFAPETTSGSDVSQLHPPEEIQAAFKRRLEWLEDRVSHHILRESLPAPFQDRLRETLDVEKRFDYLGERFFHAVTQHVVDPPLPPMWGFMAFQGFSYLLLFALFLFALAGEQAWQGLFNQPGGASILRLFLSLIQTLFSTKGLAALGSYALVNLLLGFWFYRSYRRRILRWAEKRIADLRAALWKTWADCLDDISKDLADLRDHIQSRRSALVDLSRESLEGPDPPSSQL
ncbi:MAG: 50S ribosome-binding GTPase [Deltaproteobacteria bacterium]